VVLVGIFILGAKKAPQQKQIDPGIFNPATPGTQGFHRFFFPQIPRG